MATPVLIDTSALYALLSSSDEFHTKAEETYRELLATDDELWVTSYVLVEFGALVHNRLGFDPLNKFVQATENIHNTFWIDQQIHRNAWAEFAAVRGSGMSFVDWTTLLSSRAINARLFAFDTDFDRTGVEVIP